MNITEKLERSKSDEAIDFSKMGCLYSKDPLVSVKDSKKIIVQPVWKVKEDFEGKMYTDYIKSHPNYQDVLVRSKVLRLLKMAANSLPNKYKLVVRAGHRPVEVQKRLLIEVMQDFKFQHPGVSDKKSLEHARMFVSDPDTKLPEHCCGAAVDVCLYDTINKRLVNFGSTMNDDSAISYLHAEEITTKQKENRIFLLKTMLDAGFSSYYAEWWHYSYGDQIWAWFYKEKASIYGIAEVKNSR